MAVPITYNVRNLIERKGTTLMTAFGIGLTVAVLVVVLALMDGLKTVFSGTGHPDQIIVLRKGVDAELSSSVSSEAYQIIRNLPGIMRTKDGEPMASPEGLTVVNLPSVEAPEGMNVSVRGMLPIGLEMRPDVVIQEGKMIGPGLRQVVVGEAIARRYPDARIGQQLRFGRGEWEVVGVFKAGESAANSEIWTDLNQLRGDFDREGGSSSLLVRAESQSAVRALREQIDDDQRLGVATTGEREYYERLTSSGAPLQALGFSVSIIMAIGSAFAATNTMYAAVARRSREIGTLRALGFGRWAILQSFMLESIFLALVGGVVGVLMALPVNGFQTGVGNFATFSETAFQLRVTPTAIVIGLLFAVVIGAIGGFLPAWSAARKSVLAAMRDV